MNHPLSPRHPPPRWLLLLSGVVIAAGLALGWSRGALGVMDGVGYAVCHQITVRTYVFGDRVMPLCARCTGQYLGAMAGFFMALAWNRGRASGLPSRGMTLTLVLFLAVWGLDGVNSFIFLLTQQPFLYTPHNLLRLIAGMLQGVAVSMLFLPFFNQVFWRQPDPRPALRGWRDMAAMLLLAALLTLAVNSRWPALFYPLAALSSLGAFLLLSLAGALITVMALRAENAAETWGDFLRFLLPGMAFAVLLILAIDGLRAWGELAGLP
ncbi:MAG TPA: DUF2085 domain-containing protein [Caldilineae bacterium]|nr:DUF2085 domain-containing protein [Caldilineae bacterium]